MFNSDTELKMNSLIPQTAESALHTLYIKGTKKLDT